MVIMEAAGAAVMVIPGRSGAWGDEGAVMAAVVLQYVICDGCDTGLRFLLFIALVLMGNHYDMSKIIDLTTFCK